jgi:hypothetical protein
MASLQLVIDAAMALEDTASATTAAASAINRCFTFLTPLSCFYLLMVGGAA